MSRYLLIIMTISLVACSGDSEPKEEVDFEQEMNELEEELIEPVWSVRSDGEFFEVELPTQMTPSEKVLNEDASLQYRFVQPTDSVAHEHFVIVIVEDFPEEKMEQVDLVGFTEAYMDSLMGGGNYEVLNDPAIETINEMDAIIHEFKASFMTKDEQVVELFYMLGVFKGESAMYQTLTWTLLDQKDLFRSDMKHIMYSFNEIKETDHVHDHAHDH